MSCKKLNVEESFSEIENILSRRLLTPVFQPIVDISNAKGLGYEALIRGPINSDLHSPIELFDVAKKQGLLAELEYTCREMSCQRFTALEGSGKLFVNVSPMVLLDDGFREGITQGILSRYGLNADRIVIELSEQYPLDDYELINKAACHYREMGFEIALDDIGAGYAGLRIWNEMRPDYVKIDRHFIDQIDKDFAKQEFVGSIQKIASNLGCRVIAEGIETQGQLQTVQSLGITLGQGFFLGRPESYLEYKLPDCVGDYYRPLTDKVDRLMAGDISESVKTISSDMPFEDVINLFRRDKDLSCLPVVNDDYFLGNIDRYDVLELLAWPFSHDLYRRKQSRDVMDNGCMVVDRQTPLEDISKKLAMQESLKVDNHFIVTDNGRFFGVIQTHHLFKKMTEAQLLNALYANPLTQLPGNLLIDKTMAAWMAAKSDFRVAYLDLTNFKPFNDYYGYKSGDEVIVELARITERAICSRRDFLGHIGGDDFVVLFKSHDWESRCKRILSEFDAYVPGLYDEKALDDGGISGVDRLGRACFFPLLSLAIGVVHPDFKAVSSIHDVTTIAAEAKHGAKKQTGSNIFVSRRRKPHRLTYGLIT
jgi:EAL domain-containing protein (putative c-di-GMP-specific phosphodiesterase class I)/GGDEF domain-containing protein/CBS domain-containing protein